MCQVNSSIWHQLAKLRPTTPEEVVEVLKKVSSQTSNALPSFWNATKTYQNIFLSVGEVAFWSVSKRHVRGDFLGLWQLSHLFPGGGGGFPRNPSTKT